MSILFITGYRRTGKDTLCQQIQNKSNIPFNWTVYSSPTTDLKFNQVLDLFCNGKRLAFADCLKQEVKDILGDPNLDIDKEKDRLILPDGRLLRQLLIDHGQLRRDQNPHYWIEKIIPKLEDKTIITDWRFPNEINYPYGKKIITIRVYDKNVPIPPYGVSERDLDSFCPDFFLTRGETTFDNLVTQFPVAISFDKSIVG